MTGGGFVPDGPSSLASACFSYSIRCGSRASFSWMALRSRMVRLKRSRERCHFDCTSASSSSAFLISSALPRAFAWARARFFSGNNASFFWNHDWALA